MARSAGARYRGSMAQRPPGPDISVEPWRPDLEAPSSLSGSAAIEIDVDCARIARQLKHSSRRKVGLLPASIKVDVRPFAFQLALALSQLCRSLIVVVDPLRHWPSSLEPPDDVATGMVTEDEALFFSARFLDRAIALVSPHEVAPPGAKVEMLQIVLQRLERAPSPIALTLIDMSGFARLGEFLSATDLLDGVMTVGQSRISKEDELLYLSSEIDPELDLGVVLTA